MKWHCRFGEDDDNWIDFDCAGLYPAYVAKIFVQAHFDAVDDDEEFFVVQVKKANEDTFSTYRVDIDFVPTFRVNEVKDHVLTHASAASGEEERIGS